MRQPPESLLTAATMPAADSKHGPGVGIRDILLTLAAAFLLNGLLSAENIWPTVLIRPDHRLSPEFVLIWVGLLVYAGWARRLPSRAMLGWLALVYLFLVLARYLDVSVPALFGRPVNLYWDGLQLPRFLDVASQALSPWGLAALLVAMALLLYGLFALLRASLIRLAWHAAPWAARSRPMQFLSAGALALILANFAGVQATWPVVSKPIMPTYARQAQVLATIFTPGGIDRVLPPSPPFTGDLAGLNGASVNIFFLESYGAVAYDDAEISAALAADRDRLAAAVRQTGRGVVSAFYRSPTFAGASDLAHLTLLSGIDLSDPLLHDVLITSDRPTMLSHFKAHGYEAIGLYPALSWPWPEKRYYGFDVFIDGPGLEYTGPKIGLWWIPDQYTLARFETLRQQRASAKPHILILPTINTHIPFRPIPPYQPDWQRVLTSTPFDDEPLARTMADEIDWTRLREPYPRAVRYTYDWLIGYLQQPWLGDDLLILLGDHQPVSSVSGPGASWDVPVHVITRDQTLLARLRAEGFDDGLSPARTTRGNMADLNRTLMRVFAGARPAQDVNACTSAAPAAPRNTRPGRQSASC